MSRVGIVLVLLVSCAGADATPMVRVRAAEDMVCAESTIRVTRRMDGTYRAVGCGKHVTYRSVCQGTQCSVSRAGESPEGPAVNAAEPDLASPH